MPYERRSKLQSRAVEPSDYDVFGLGAEWGERNATGVVAAVGVMIVALIAVLMGMA